MTGVGGRRRGGRRKTNGFSRHRAARAGDFRGRAWRFFPYVFDQDTGAAEHLRARPPGPILPEKHCHAREKPLLPAHGQSV